MSADCRPGWVVRGASNILALASISLCSPALAPSAWLCCAASDSLTYLWVVCFLAARSLHWLCFNLFLISERKKPELHVFFSTAGCRQKMTSREPQAFLLKRSCPHAKSARLCGARPTWARPGLTMQRCHYTPSLILGLLRFDHFVQSWCFSPCLACVGMFSWFCCFNRLLI